MKETICKKDRWLGIDIVQWENINPYNTTAYLAREFASFRGRKLLQQKYWIIRKEVLYYIES